MYVSVHEHAEKQIPLVGTPRDISLREIFPVQKLEEDFPYADIMQIPFPFLKTSKESILLLEK